MGMKLNLGDVYALNTLHEQLEVRQRMVESAHEELDQLRLKIMQTDIEIKGAEQRVQQLKAWKTRQYDQKQALMLVLAERVMSAHRLEQDIAAS